MERFGLTASSKIPLLLFGLLGWTGMVGCDPKPSLETCQRYYDSVVRISRSGPRVLELLSRTSSSKAVIVDYCLTQPRHQIECAIRASSLPGLQECESRPKQGIRDSLPDLSEFGDFGSEE